MCARRLARRQRRCQAIHFPQSQPWKMNATIVPHWGERLDCSRQYLPSWAAKANRRARGRPAGG
jgi:hypothetical protein